MAFQPVNSFHRHLEKTDPEIQAGRWRISTLTDLITEKRYLCFSVRSRGLPNLAPSVIPFRSEAAVSLVPEHCAQVLHTSTDGDRIDLFTPFYDPVDPSRLDDVELRRLIDTLIRTFALFERHRFYASDLFKETVGRTGADSFVLLPAAYVFPEVNHAPGPNGVLRTVDSPTRTGGHIRWPGFEEGAHHTVLLGHFIADCFGTASKTESRRGSKPSFQKRLLDAAEAIADGRVISLGALYSTLFDKRLGKVYERFPPLRSHADLDPRLKGVVDQLLASVSVDGSITVLKGEFHTGKSTVLGATASLLERSGEYEVHTLDEWDLFTKSRARSAKSRRGAGTKSTTQVVWLIDDIDERTLACSALSRAIVDADAYPKGSFVFTVCSTGTSADTNKFLLELRDRQGERFNEITLDGPRPDGLDGFVEDVLSRLPADTGAGSPKKRRKHSDPLDTLLSRLKPEETQLLEFLAVSRFALPLEVILSVFPEPDSGISSGVCRLASLDIVEKRYRQISPKGSISAFLRIRSVGLRRSIYAKMPRARRKKLHRTVALVAERSGGFPPYFLLYHCLKAEEIGLAARHFVSYLRETRGERRDRFTVSLYEQIVDGKLLEDLPFSDQVFACYELSVDLVKENRTPEAEKLLIECEQLMREAEPDQKLKSATLLSECLRRLADRWETRGEFKRALDLLDSVKFELQSALSIPDQAQLLNDIGWLQYRLGDYEGSMESCRLSLNTLNPNQYPLIVAQALNLMGVVHYNSSRYDEAISYYEQSAHLRERAGDENAMAASFNNLALAYQSKGEYEKALDYYKKSLMLKGRQNNQAGIAAGYLNLALLYVDMRNFKEAEAKCRESLAVCEKLDDAHAQLIPDNYITLGDIALEDGDLKTAEKHYEESLRIARRMEAINEEMGALRRLSSISLRQKRYDEARNYADGAFDLVQRIGSRYENAQIEDIFGDLEFEKGHHTEALRHYEKAASQFTSLSKYRLAAKVFAKIGIVHAETGNTFEARHNLDRAHDFVRADIGRELPEEYVKLQQRLRARPPKTDLVGEESQKLLMAIYDLSALTDYVSDSHEFFGRIMDVIREIVSPRDCALALRTERNRFVLFDSMGARRPSTDDGLNTLFRESMLLGGLIDSGSPDISDVLPSLSLPEGTAFVCIPLKAMSEDLGCLLLVFDDDRLPLAKEDVSFFTSLGRQIAGNLMLMLHLNDEFLKDEILEKREEQPRTDDEPRTRFEPMIGKSESMRNIFRTLERVKDSDSGILILGESGTGKSALARAIHYKSPRRARPFQEIHCAQIPFNLLESELFGHERGAFTGAVQRKLGLCEIADGGTVFLDDINVIPAEMQAKLLHFLESKSFMRLGGGQTLTSDVRIIAASNEDLEMLCRDGRFREDLYFRLKVILIDLPPLRERKEDMIAIALDYLKRSCAEKGIPLKTLSPETIQLLQKAPWRGNVRELQNVLERVVVLSDDNIITPSSLPEDFLREAMGTSRQSQRRLDELVDEIVKLGGYSEASPLLPLLEALLAKKMVDHVDGKNKAAGLLGVSKPTLYARLRDYEKLH
ncbi:MAG: sigma 54-interacting transcriptional regulator [Candidatus Latescibacterota bacterium]|nr:MAG: sigma 54-interacting transcriptional regulator [Candidatus Latescibacterota bacterium]